MYHECTLIAVARENNKVERNRLVASRSRNTQK